MIDCSTFHDCEVDALYSEGAERELDDEAMVALTEHAKTCTACAARLERLRDNRRLVLSVAVEAVPGDFESRIMAAVDAALAKRAAAAPAPAPAPAAAAPAGGGATILRFMARPSFAVAATFVLVLSAAAFMMTRRSSPMAALSRSDEAPAAVAASAASPVMAAPPAVTVAVLPAGESAPYASAVAVAAATAAPPAYAMSPPPAAGAPVALAAKGAKPAAGPQNPALESAKALASAGRCAEALPKLEALAPSAPEADLYAARCIAKTRGCAAAEPRFDRAAQTNAGTEIGSRAQLEGAKCYQSTGDVVAARKRYAAAKDEGTLSAEATQALEALDGNAAAPAKPGTPSAGAHASPKAAPAPRTESPTR